MERGTSSFVLDLPPKLHDGTALGGAASVSVAYRNNTLARSLRKATQMQPLGGVSVLAPLSGFLN
jgi:hypothetical protein